MKLSRITLRLAALCTAASMLAAVTPGHAGAITSPKPVTLSPAANVAPGSAVTVSSPPGSFPINPITIPGRTITDGQTLTGDNILVSTGQGHFSSSDLNRPVSGPGIPSGTVIVFIVDANDAAVLNNFTATATGLTVVLGPVQVAGRGLTLVCNQYVFLLAGLGGGRQLEGCDNHSLPFGDIGPSGELLPIDIHTPLGANVDTGGGFTPDATATCPPPVYQTQIGYSCVVYVLDVTVTNLPLAINFAPLYVQTGRLEINPPAGNGGSNVTVMGQNFACGVTTVRTDGTQYCSAGEQVSVSVAGGGTVITTAFVDGTIMINNFLMPALGANKAPFKVKITATGQTSGIVQTIKYVEVG